MACAVCAIRLRPKRGDLPFSVSERTIALIKDLPVSQCENRANYLLEDGVVSRVDVILASVDNAAELEAIRYAA